MSQVPELDQVADARRKLAAHAGYPRWYWALYGLLTVLIVGQPLWRSALPPSEWTLASWVPAGILLALVVADRIRRHRSGVRLHRKISAYPGATPAWVATLAVACAGYLGVNGLTQHGHRLAALALVVLVAAAVFLGTTMIRSRMRTDIEAGRVGP